MFKGFCFFEEYNKLNLKQVEDKWPQDEFYQKFIELFHSVSANENISDGDKVRYQKNLKSLFDSKYEKLGFEWKLFPPEEKAIKEYFYQEYNLLRSLGNAEFLQQYDEFSSSIKNDRSIDSKTKEGFLNDLKLLYEVKTEQSQQTTGIDFNGGK